MDEPRSRRGPTQRERAVTTATAAPLTFVEPSPQPSMVARVRQCAGDWPKARLNARLNDSSAS
jgi:hypothetical protein